MKYVPSIAAEKATNLPAVFTDELIRTKISSKSTTTSGSSVGGHFQSGGGVGGLFQ